MMHLTIIGGELFAIMFAVHVIGDKRIVIRVGYFASEDGSGHKFIGNGIAIIDDSQHFYCKFYYDNLRRKGYISIDPAVMLENASPQTRLKVCDKIAKHYEKTWNVQPSPHHHRIVEYMFYELSNFTARDLISEIDNAQTKK